MTTVADAAVAAYLDLTAHLARRLDGLGGAEYDDLEQEGRIFVWQSLARGIRPSAELIEARMLNWVRWLNRKEVIPYELMCPLDDYAGTLADPR